MGNSWTKRQLRRAWTRRHSTPCLPSIPSWQPGCSVSPMPPPTHPLHATTADVSNDVTSGHLRGSALLVAGRVIAILVNFAVQVVTVRYLPRPDYGIFAFALSVATVVAVASAFGT